MMNSAFWSTVLTLLLGTLTVHAQTGNLTGSPYSLFGLGVGTNSNIGKNSALGKGGYALWGDEFINNYNPAAFAAAAQKNFMFDIGMLTEISTVSSNNNEERRLASNISSIALASSLSPRSGFGITLAPHSDVGYALIGIQSNIEGSFESFVSNIFGSGGLNDLKLSYGYQINDYINTGLGLSYLFGSINETERIAAGTSTLTVEERNGYSGLRLDLGLQAKLSERIRLGVRWQLPTSLNAERDQIVTKVSALLTDPDIVENTTGEEIESFDLPLVVSTGIQINPVKSLSLNLDYSKSYWNATEQNDNIGTFINQDIMAFGAEYLIDRNGFKYWERIQFRAGFTYDTGYLEVNNEPIDSYSITAGLGLPLGRYGRSKINLSYTYRSGGSSEGILVQETFNTLNINVSLNDIWFLKRKIN